MDKETDFAPHCLCLDLEVDPVDKRILEVVLPELVIEPES